MTDDDDLFAVRPAPRRRRPKPLAVPAPEPGRPASLACPCGWREEIRDAVPDRLDCPACHKLDGLVRYVPRYPPPIGAGRDLTAIERDGLRLDGLA